MIKTLAKKILQNILPAFLISTVVTAGMTFAADRYWVGSGGNWSDSANWSSTSGGTGGASVPTSIDRVFFDSSSGNAVIDIDANAEDINLQADYLGTVSLGTRKITLSADAGRGIDILGGTIDADEGTIEFIGTAPDNSIELDGGTLRVENFIVNKPFTTPDSAVGIPAGNTLIVEGTTTLTQGELQSTGTLIAEGPFNLASTFTSINGGFNVTLQTNGTVNLPSNVNLTSARFTIDNSATTVTPTGASDFEIDDLTITANGGTFDNSNNLDLPSWGDIVINGGTFNKGDSTLTITRDFNMSGGIFNAGSGAMNMTVSPRYFTLSGGTFNGDTADMDLENVDITGGIFNAGTSGILDTEDSFDINGSTAEFYGGGKNITVTGSFTNFNHINGDADLENADLTVGSDFNMSKGTFLCGTGTISLGDYLAIGDSSTDDAPDPGLVFDCSNATALEMGLYFDLNLDDSLVSFIAPSNIMTVGGNWQHQDASTFDANGGTVVFDGTVNQNYQSLSGDNAATPFYNLVINKPAGTSVVSTNDADLNVTNHLEITSGTLSFTDDDIYVSGDFIMCPTAFSPGLISTDCSLTTPGDAVLTQSNSTFNFNGGDQNIYGDNITFNGLSKIATADSTLTFEAGNTFNANGTTTFGSNSTANILSLRSSSDNTQVNFAPSGARIIYNVDVKDNNNTSTEIVLNPIDNSTDSGNNTNWTFNTSTVGVNSVNITPSSPGTEQDMIANASLTASAIPVFNWFVDGNSITEFLLEFEGHTGDESSLTLDLSGNENNGIVSNADWGGSFGYNDNSGGYYFDGLGSDYITLANNHYDSITVATWFKTDDATKEQVIISKTQSGEYQLMLNQNSVCTANHLCFIIHDGTTYYGAEYDASNISDNVWHHVVGTYDGETVSIYVDGILREANTDPSGNIQSNSSPICIGEEAGSSSCNGGLNFQGYIDQVIISDRVYTAGQIENIYTYGNLSVIDTDETTTGEEWTVAVYPVNNDLQEVGQPASDTETIQAQGLVVPEFSFYMLLLTVGAGFWMQRH